MAGQIYTWTKPQDVSISRNFVFTLRSFISPTNTTTLFRYRSGLQPGPLYKMARECWVNGSLRDKTIEIILFNATHASFLRAILVPSGQLAYFQDSGWSSRVL